MKELDDNASSADNISINSSKIIREELFSKSNSFSKYFPVSCISILEKTNDLILVINLRYKIEYVNQYIKELTGFSCEEVLGKNILNFLDENENRRIRAILKEISREKEKFSLLRITFFSKTGEKKIGEVNGVPILNNYGEITGYFCIVRNITEREQAEGHLESLVIELKNNIARKDKFFSIVAHDLKSPFHGLLGLSGIITKEFEKIKTEDLRRYLININTTARNVYTLVEDLLEWARMQTNHFDFQPEKLILAGEVEKAIYILKENASNKDIRILNKVKSDIYVHVDQKMLQSILLSLITNALKFSYPGSEVVIDSEPMNEFEAVRVIDNGTGISKENQDKLFRLDTHFSTLGTKKEVGTGLGLLLCKEQLELNGGKIWVESEAEQGSKFIFTLQKI